MKKLILALLVALALVPVAHASPFSYYLDAPVIVCTKDPSQIPAKPLVPDFLTYLDGSQVRLNILTTGPKKGDFAVAFTLTAQAQITTTFNAKKIGAVLAMLPAKPAVQTLSLDPLDANPEIHWELLVVQDAKNFFKVGIVSFLMATGVVTATAGPDEDVDGAVYDAIYSLRSWRFQVMSMADALVYQQSVAKNALAE
jgi:hypothetical protein